MTYKFIYVPIFLGVTTILLGTVISSGGASLGGGRFGGGKSRGGGAGRR